MAVSSPANWKLASLLAVSQRRAEDKRGGRRGSYSAKSASAARKYGALMMRKRVSAYRPPAMTTSDMSVVMSGDAIEPPVVAARARRFRN
jgi:hypothetical protein